MSGIIRLKKKRNPFVTIDKTPLEDERLSWKARGIIAYLLTKPDDWKVNTANLVRASDKDGRETVYSALKELEETGYIARYQAHDEQGRFTGWETVIFETPEDASEWKAAQDTGKPDTGKPDTGKPDTGKPDTGKPDTGKPDTANPQQLINKDPLIPDQINTPPYVPPEGEQEQEGGEEASLKEEEEPGADNTLSLGYKAQEDVLEEEDITLGSDQISAPPEAFKDNFESSGKPNFNGASQMVKELRAASQESKPTAPTPKPVLRADSAGERNAKEGEWECPIPEKYWDFLQYEAERLIREKVCPRAEARGKAIAILDSNKRQSDVKFEDWMLEQQRQQEQPTERPKLEARPHFKLEPKRDVTARIAEYHRLGEEEFLKQKSWHQEWLDLARKEKLI